MRWEELRGSQSPAHTCPSRYSTCLGSQGLCFVLTGTGRHPHWLSSLSLEGSRACFSTPRPEGGKATSEAGG